MNKFKLKMQSFYLKHKVYTLHMFFLIFPDKWKIPKFKSKNYQSKKQTINRKKKFCE